MIHDAFDATEKETFSQLRLDEVPRGESPGRSQKFPAGNGRSQRISPSEGIERTEALQRSGETRKLFLCPLNLSGGFPSKTGVKLIDPVGSVDDEIPRPNKKTTLGELVQAATGDFRLRVESTDEQGLILFELGLDLLAAGDYQFACFAGGQRPTIGNKI